MNKLAIAFWINALYACEDSIYCEYDKRVKELCKRGFNAIRIDDGAGFFTSPDGTEIKELSIASAFGKYSKFIRQCDTVKKGKCNIRENLFKIATACKKYNVKLILSSWYFLHQNWYLDELTNTDMKKINDDLFNLSTEDKISFFADELIRILDFLKSNDLICTVDFVELFNEFDGLYFAGGYEKNISKEDSIYLRGLHEQAIEKIKKAYPQIKVAYDSFQPNTNNNMIPRNVDIFNFHCYYMWPVYNFFEDKIIVSSLEEPVIPEETKKYLLDNPVSVKDVFDDRGSVIRTSIDWGRRVALYSSISPDKEKMLSAKLEEELIKNIEKYKNNLIESVETAIDIKNRILPNALLVMGEGVTYCAANLISFEENSKTYWDTIYFQQQLLNKSGFYGTVVRTTSGPEDPSWNTCVSEYNKANEMFLK